MLNLLKESSKKSPFRYRFSSKGKDKLQEELKPKGLKFTFKFDRDAAELDLILETRFFVIVFLFLSLYIFGSETGNLWAYMLAAVALAAVVLGVLLPLFQVLETKVFFNLPSEAVARERLNLRVKVTRKDWWGFLAKFLPIKWLLVQIKLVRLGEKENMLRPIMVEHLTSEAWVVAQTPRLRRGVYTLEAIEIFSCYPFGLAWWNKRSKLTDKFAAELASGLEVQDKDKLYSGNTTRAIDGSRSSLPQMTVYPRINNIDGNFLFRLRATGDSALFFSSSRPIAALTSASVRSLREFRSGDSPRFIHWPSSAKTGKLMIREFESEGLPGFDVLLDLTSDWKNEDQFELAVSITLSLLQLGYKLGGAPELFVIPSLDEDHESLPEILTDLPPIARGIGWSSQILARVEALSLQDSEYRAKVPQVGFSDTMALLTVRPSENIDQEQEESAPKDRATEERANRQVDLWVLSRAYLEADSTLLSAKRQAAAPIPLHAMGSGDRRSEGTAPAAAGEKPARYGRILASLSEFEELSHL